MTQSGGGGGGGTTCRARQKPCMREEVCLQKAAGIPPVYIVPKSSTAISYKNTISLDPHT